MPWSRVLQIACFHLHCLIYDWALKWSWGRQCPLSYDSQPGTFGRVTWSFPLHRLRCNLFSLPACQTQFYRGNCLCGFPLEDVSTLGPRHTAEQERVHSQLRFCRCHKGSSPLRLGLWYVCAGLASLQLLLLVDLHNYFHLFSEFILAPATS